MASAVLFERHPLERTVRRRADDHQQALCGFTVQARQAV
jgi:hypothetical protein